MEVSTVHVGTGFLWWVEARHRAELGEAAGHRGGFRWGLSNGAGFILGCRLISVPYSLVVWDRWRSGPHLWQVSGDWFSRPLLPSCFLNLVPAALSWEHEAHFSFTNKQYSKALRSLSPCHYHLYSGIKSVKSSSCYLIVFNACNAVMLYIILK